MVERFIVTCVLQLHAALGLVPESVSVVHHGEAEVGQKLGSSCLVTDPTTIKEVT